MITVAAVQFHIYEPIRAEMQHQKMAHDNQWYHNPPNPMLF